MQGIFAAWASILAGRTPLLSVEITRECPLRCPGCYAYEDNHLGGAITLRQLSDRKGQDLVDSVLKLVEEVRPLHVSFVGGEPLVRFRELDILLPLLSRRGLHTQVVTSAVREIPKSWSEIRNLSISVSVDGLQPEHDARRKPATYERILKHIAGHRVTIHCTVTGPQARRPGYLREFLKFWSERPETKRIWFSLYSPQVGEQSPEMLTAAERQAVVSELTVMNDEFPKLQTGKKTLAAYLNPPQSPSECIFARTTTVVSADLKTRVTPCMLGGKPDCTACGCMASGAFAAVGRTRLLGVLPLGVLFEASLAIGSFVRDVRSTPVGEAGAAEPQGAKADGG